MDFIDLKAQQERIRSKVDHAIMRVLDHGQYIMGPEVFQLEEQLAKFCGAKYTISCANGTTALELALLAKNISTGDAVFVPSFTFAATAEVVPLLGGTPVFVDVLPDTFNMDPNSLEEAIDHAKKMGLKPKVIITVDLFGQPCDYHAIKLIARDHNLTLIADAAQSFGGTYYDKSVGNLADITTTSFFPAKPFGCYGDGGAIFTNDEALVEVLRSIRIHGQGKDRYENIRIGINGRLDTIQAAILLEKLEIFPDEIVKRNVIAKNYSQQLKNICLTPVVLPQAKSVWAQYTVLLEKRDEIQTNLKKIGIPTMVYYQNPMHLQKPYIKFPRAPHGLPVTEQLAKSVLSLPMHPYLTSAAQEKICFELNEAILNSNTQTQVLVHAK